MTGFWKGIIAGFAAAMVLIGVVCACWLLHQRDKELIEYAKRQMEIEALREDYGNRNPYEFLDGVPGVRGAAESAAAEFERKRNEAVQRLRGGLAD